VRVSGVLRQQQRAASEAAILGAAWELFAQIGPDGASLRDVGREAGCTHALVTRYYGSKSGLVAAVSERLTDQVRSTVVHIVATSNDPLLGVMAAARERPSCVRLLVRCALGDLQPAGFPACLDVQRVLEVAQADTPVGRGAASRRSRLCGYAAASLLLGWITFEGFLVAATGLGRMGGHRRDVAVADGVRRLLTIATQPSPTLRPRDLSGLDAGTAERGQPPVSSRDALLSSAIELFAEHGPASVSVRDVGRHAQVNPGLIYRHFGSKEALLEEAIEQGSSGLFPAALTPEGFDFDAVSQRLHNSSLAPRLIARTLVDGIDIRLVRRRFPVLHRLLGDLGPVRTGPGPVGLSDPRFAVVATAGMALGSAVWGPHLRSGFGLSDLVGIESAIADLSRLLIAVPAAGDGGPGG
jgi:TetR/AcrR family transcriptional regulator, repressor for neighboring sulfatase